MKGIICAGGKGTRLLPLTKVVNKHLLPVYDKPMIMYPLQTLLDNNIEEIVIVCHMDSLDQFKALLGDGSSLGCNLSYRIQNESKGISDAIFQARDICHGSKVAVILGDNIFFSDLSLDKEKNVKCNLFLKEVEDPRRYGVASVSHSKIVKIVEKPVNPESNLAVTGLYVFDENVFDYIEKLRPSDRGELEVTDLCNLYLKNSSIGFTVLESEWLDAGTFESLHLANIYARQHLGLRKTKNLSIKL